MAHPRPGVVQPAHVGRGRIVAGDEQDERARVLSGLPIRVQEGRLGAGDPLAHRLLGGVEQPGDLTVGEAGVEVQEEDEALVCGQAGESLARRVGRRRLLRGTPDGGLLVERDGRAPRAAAQLVDGEVVAGPLQPRPLALRAQPVGQAAPRAGERLLGEVLGGVAIARQGEGQPGGELIVVGADEVFEIHHLTRR